jgi:hypothetical protein
MDLKKMIEEEIQKRKLKEDHQFQQDLDATIKEVCRCLSSFNSYEFATNSPDKAGEMIIALKKVQDMCLNAPIHKPDNTPDLLRRDVPRGMGSGGNKF